MSTDILRELEILIRARYPLLYLVSWEEQRVLEAIEAVAVRRQKKVFKWSITEGMEGQTASGAPEEVSRVLAALDQILRSYEPALYVLRDFHHFLAPHFSQRATVLRKLRDVAQHLKTSHKTVLLVSPILELPAELEKDVTVVDFPLPGLKELGDLLDHLLQSVHQSASVTVALTDDQREQVLKAALGLTLNEAENVFAKSLVTTKALDVPVIVSEKEQIIRKSGLLEYYHATEQFDDIGGLDLLKEWLRKRTRAFSEEARAFGLPVPKGILLIGVQGCGKSLCCKSLAALWHLPLLRLDVGNIFGAYIGESERNIRQAMRVAESISPAILWLDELEKGFAGTRGSGSTDAGTTARVFGSFITWLQDKQAPVFVIATANDIRQLPPELLRKGRFDDIFFIDLPAEEERADIFRIHLARRRRDPARFDVERLAQLTAGFSGAEIEQAIVAAMYDAFDARRDVGTEDVAANVAQTYPLSHTMSAQIQALREWAATRARPASSRAAAEAANLAASGEREDSREAVERLLEELAEGVGEG